MWAGDLEGSACGVQVLGHGAPGLTSWPSSSTPPGGSASRNHAAPHRGIDRRVAGGNLTRPPPQIQDVNLSVHPARAAQSSGRGAVLPVREQTGRAFCDGGQPCPCPFVTAL